MTSRHFSAVKPDFEQDSARLVGFDCPAGWHQIRRFWMKVRLGVIKSS